MGLSPHMEPVCLWGSVGQVEACWAVGHSSRIPRQQTSHCSQTGPGATGGIATAGTGDQEARNSGPAPEAQDNGTLPTTSHPQSPSLFFLLPWYQPPPFSILKLHLLSWHLSASPLMDTHRPDRCPRIFKTQPCFPSSEKLLWDQ